MLKEAGAAIKGQKYTRSGLLCVLELAFIPARNYNQYYE